MKCLYEVVTIGRRKKFPERNNARYSILNKNIKIGSEKKW